MDTQIRSKERVLAYGEVFTDPREVNAMLDLVKPETDRIDSRFLEPACGDGNFLIEILRRKLAICETRVTAKRYTQLQNEHDAVWAVSSIYGIEIQEDNASACRERLLNGLKYWSKYSGAKPSQLHVVYGGTTPMARSEASVEVFR